MTNVFLFILAVGIIFAPIGLGMGLTDMIVKKNWGELILIFCLVSMTFLWLQTLNENINIRKKLKDYEKICIKDE